MRKQELHPRTAILNKKQKNQSKMARNEALAWLALTFPHAFDNRVRIQPLKLGIMHDILAYADKAAATGISVSKLREAVVVFTRRIDYLTALKAREMRIDLLGNPIDQVTEEEAEHAADKIKKRVEKGAKNARKNLFNKVSEQKGIQPAKYTEQDFIPQYPERAVSFGAQSNSIIKPRSPFVVVTHKTTRQYDPDAVARLKEKLGLSRKLDAETADNK